MAFENPFFSDKARAWLGSIQGVPEDQVPAKANLAAQAGLMSFPEALAIKMIADRIRAPQGNMPEGTVMSEMLGGIAGIDAGRMENPSFAGGGIVAFSDGGGVSSAQVDRILKKHPINRTAEDNEILRRAGLQLERRAPLPEDSALARFDRFLGTPFYREATAAPYASDEEVAKGGTANLTNEAIARMLGAEQVVQAPSQAPSQPAPSSGGPSRRFRNVIRSESGERTPPPVEEELPPSNLKIPERPSAALAASDKRLAIPEEAPKGTMEYYKELQDFRAKEGIGETRKKRMEYLSGEEKKLEEEFGKDRMLAFAELGFKMAGAASRPGATFMGALAEGAISGTQALRGLNKEYRANRRALIDANFQLQEAEEKEKEGDFKTANKMREDATERLARAREANAKIEVDLQRIAASVYGAELGAATSRENTQATKEATAALNANRASAELQDRRNALLDKLGYNMTYMALQNETDPVKKEQQRAQLNAIEAQANKLLGVSGGTPAEIKSLVSKYAGK